MLSQIGGLYLEHGDANIILRHRGQGFGMFSRQLLAMRETHCRYTG